MLSSEWKALDAGQRRFIATVAALTVVLYAGTTALAVRCMLDDKAADQRNHQARMSPNLVEPGRTLPDPLPPRGNFVTVKVGSYIDTISNLSIRDSTWSAEFYIWLNWRGQADLDPGGKLVLVEGTILDKQLLDDYHSADGVNYQRYRIAAKFQKFFNTTMVPVERPMLNIYIEDGARDGTLLRYAADDTSNISSRARLSNYNVVGIASVVKPHTYRTSYGDPREQESRRATFSQYVVGISLEKTGLGIYFKIFLCLYAALALAIANFFVKPDIGPRLVLPTVAYFGVVANTYVVSSVLPPSSGFGMVDFVTAFGLGTIFLTLALSLLSSYLWDQKGEAAFAVSLDWFLFWTVTVCCVAANIAIPLSVVL